MKFWMILLIAPVLQAQTTRYPGAVDSDSSLFVVADNLQTSLSVAMATTDTVAVVASGTGFLPNMIATICDTQTNTGKCTAWEHMFVTAVSGNILTVVRGFAGTTARTHTAGRLVSALIDAAHQKVLKDSIVAIENTLGPNLINISTGAQLSSGNFNFPAYSCDASSNCLPAGPSGGTLVAGNNTLTMSPVPGGVNGTDTGHYLYVSGGTGTAEPCLITGGGAVSGAASGAVIVNCAASHSGAWTVQSAGGGIPEAIQAAITKGGGVVSVPQGIVNLYAMILLRSNITLSGAGRGATVLTVANGAFKNTAAWTFATSQYAAMSTVSGAVNAGVAHLTLDMNGANQIINWVQAWGITTFNATNSSFDDIEIKNGPIPVSGISFLNFAFTAASNYNVIRNSYITNQSCSLQGATNGMGATGGSYNRFQNNVVTNGCNTAYGTGHAAAGSVLDGPTRGNVFVGNVFDIKTSTQSPGSQAIASDSATQTTFIGNICIGGGGYPACFSTATDVASVDDVDTTFIDNFAYNCSYGYLISGTQPNANQQARGTKIHGGSVTGCVNGINVGDWVQGLIVDAVLIHNNTSNGVYTKSVANGSIGHMQFVNNQIYNNTGPGVVFDASTGTYPVTDLIMVGNYLYDSRASGKTQTYPISFPANTAPVRVRISENNFSGHATADDPLVAYAGGLPNLISNAQGTYGPNQGGSSANMTMSVQAGTIQFNATLTNGLNSNINIGNYYYVIGGGPTAAYSIGGFTAPGAGINRPTLQYFNSVLQTLTIVNTDASSVPANQICTLTGGNVVLRTAGQSFASFKYEPSLNGGNGCWVLTATN